MQNKKSKSFRSFVKEKGYYIVLLLCAVTVGVSGYLLLTGRQAADPVETPVNATLPSEQLGTAPTQGSVNPTEPSKSTEPGKQPAEQTMAVVAPVEGEILTAFAADHLAYNLTTRDWRTHEGVDLAAALGQKVVAAADGTVHTIYEDESLGMTVVLRHANGYTTHYSNLAEETAVSVGDVLSAGATIGTVGQTACVETAAAPHIHFAVYQNNVPVNPEDFLSTE